MKKNKKWFLIIPLVLLVGYFLYDTFNRKSIEELSGGFKEVAFVRNEQNKGGIVRVYAVTVSDPMNAAYDQCADMFPVNDYASVTKIYFFDSKEPFPESLSIQEPHYDVSKYKAINILKRRGSNK